MSFFNDKSDIIADDEFALNRTPTQGTGGKKCRLITNCFSITMGPNGAIYHHRYTITPEAKDEQEERWVLQNIWGEIQKQFSVFVVRCPGHIFSNTGLTSKLQLSTPAVSDLGYAAHKVSIYLHHKYDAEHVNAGLMGESCVVAQHIVKKLVEPLRYQKAGRRYFNTVDMGDAQSSAREAKAKINVFSGFYAALNSLNAYGPQLQLDMMYRCYNRQSIIKSLATGLEQGSPMDLKDPDMVAEWTKRCVCSTVVTLYNQKLYRIKKIHFDMAPTDSFEMYQRDEKAKKKFTYVEYYEAFYETKITELEQPLLEAYAEKESENVFLIPELCAFTGFNDEVRKDKNVMSEALKLSKASPQERLAGILEQARIMAQGKSGEIPSKHVTEWKFGLQPSPLEIDARIFEPLQVDFGRKQFPIEDGNFQRWMRNGLQCPAALNDWFFIYPEQDQSVLDIWLRSLRDVAQVAFGMKIADPQRIVCSDQRKEIVGMLENKVSPKTQFILLLTPQKDCKQVYQAFKQATCSKIPVVSQVVKSETIRRRQSIAAVLSRIVLQINAKCCGSLWHVALEVKETHPLFAGPTMVVGIDVFTSPENEKYFGFAGSLNMHCSEFFSTAGALDTSTPENTAQDLSVKIQIAFRDALLHFARRNEKMLPEHVIVYRGSVNQDQWLRIRATEIQAIQQVLESFKNGQGAIKSAPPREDVYEPHLTFVAIAQRTGTRFFQTSPNQTSVKNPEPGTVIDSPVISPPNTHSFYLISQSVTKGTAVPTQYTILHDSYQVPLTSLQNLTYRLSFMYFNVTGSIRVPAPAQYAKKIAQFVGTAVRTDIHQRLLTTFFYL